MSARQLKVLIVFSTVMIGSLFAGGDTTGAAPYYYGWTVGDSWNGYGTILRSIDSGETWTRQGAGQIADVTLGAVSTVDPYTVWVVGYSDGYATIYHTSDGGTTWVRKGSQADVPDVDLIKVHASDENHVWAVGDGTILHTGDGGATWANRIPPGYEDIPLQGVYAPDSATVWVTGGPKDGFATILKSTDSGLSWSRQSGGDFATSGYDHILGISAIDTETAWAIGGDDTSMGWFVLKTTDGGSTWIEQTKGALDGNNICAVDSSTVWAVSDTTISRSTDGGTTWETHNSSYYTMGISAVNSLEAWAITSGLSGSIRHTTDGGINWTVLTELGGETIPSLGTISFSNLPVPAPTPEDFVLDSGDYNGDGTDDIAIFRSSSGLWAVRGITRAYFGTSSDIPVPGDYDGDGSTEIGIFRSASGLWAVKGVTRVYFGSTDDIPVPFSSNPSSACIPGIFRESSSLWALRGLTRIYFGSSGDWPIPGDYDGDGTREIGIFRETSGLWAIRALTRIYFGNSNDTTTPGDYDGDGAWEAGVFRPATGLWAIRGVTRSYFGGNTDDPVPADYGGDGSDDIGIFRNSSGLWAIRGVTRAYFGTTGDIPVTR